MTTPRLETRDLALGYHGATFATGIDLSLAPAEIVAILGPSGSGKSTLLATIAGVVPQAGGTVLVDGIDVTDLPIHRRGIGMIFQEPLLFPHLSVADNVAYGLRRQGRPRDLARERAEELLDWLGLAGLGRGGWTSSAAARPSAWPSRGPWPRSRPSSCSTSPSAHSTSTCASDWRSTSPRCCGTRAWPPCTSRTTQGRPRPCPIASSPSRTSRTDLTAPWTELTAHPAVPPLPSDRTEGPPRTDGG